MIFPVCFRDLPESRLRLHACIVWRIGFLLGGLLSSAGGVYEAIPVLFWIGIAVATAGLYVETWEFDSSANRVRYSRGLVLPFATEDFPLNTVVAIRIVQSAGGLDDVADYSSSTGRSSEIARGFRRGFTKLLIEFDDGTRRAIHRDSAKAYSRMLPVAMRIAEFAEIEMFDE